MKHYDFGFIGVGNMGSALCRAVAKGGHRIAVTDANTEKAAALSRELGCTPLSLAELVTSCDYLFLGVKPQMMATLAKELAPLLKTRIDRFVLVSMAAGMKIETIAALFGNFPIIRIMPNIPASVGMGVILTSIGTGVRAEETARFLASMEHAGLRDVIPEELIDAGCALSGSGPAYVYMFLDALADGAVSCGLTREQALLYAKWTVMGAASHALSVSEEPDTLKCAVCSPGGTTLEGVGALNAAHFHDTVGDAVRAAYRRALELAKK